MLLCKLVVFTVVIVAVVCSFEVPDATVEILEPRGFKVSIPHVDGIKLFALHANINEEFNGREAGQFARDVNAAENGRWTFTDTNTKLKPGDTIYYWTYVDYFDGERKLGYAKDDQEYTVKSEPAYSQENQVNEKVNMDCKPSLTTASGLLKPQQICSEQLIFSDEFNHFDLQKWQHENTLAGGGNWEFQWYLNNRTNSFVEDGILNIHPTLLSEQFGESFLTTGTLDITGGEPVDSCTNPAFYGCVRRGNNVNIVNPIKSALIKTVDSFSFKYGRVEIRAKIPVGDWMWPAIWLMPRYNSYGTWPASGEIDLLESRGNKQLIVQGKNIGTNLVTSTLQFGSDYFHNGVRATQYGKTLQGGFDTQFHNYTLVWTTDALTFYYDEHFVGSAKPGEGGFWELGGLNNSGVANPWKSGTKLAPFDQEFYLLLNVAVGGTNGFFPDGVKGKPWKNSSPKAATDFWNGRASWLPSWQSGQSSDHSLQVDYVRVYAL